MPAALQVEAPHDAVAPLVLQACDLPADDVPAAVLIAPFGEVVSTHGEFLVDEAAMHATIAAFAAHGTDLPIDFEHQSLGGDFSSPTGLAPAAGWIKALVAVPPRDELAPPAAVVPPPPPLGQRPVSPQPDPAVPFRDAGSVTDSDDALLPCSQADLLPPHAPPAHGPVVPFSTPGLWAKVEWTPLALELLRTRQYRYLSPVALIRRSDRRMIGLHSVALTNKPAILGSLPIVAKDVPPHAPAPRDAAPLERLRQLVHADANANDDVVLLAAADRLAALLSRADALAVAERVRRAVAAGKLAPAQRVWALRLARRDPAAFDEWFAAAPQIVPLGPTRPPAATDDSADVRRLTRRARDEYNRHRDFLHRLCSEEAFVADALRSERLSATAGH